MRSGAYACWLAAVAFVAVAASSAEAVNTPKLVWGTVVNSDSSVPDPTDITFAAHIEGRSGEVLTQASAGCGVETVGAETQYYLECGNFTTQWQPGDILVIQATNNANGESASPSPTLDATGAQRLDIQLHTLLWTLTVTNGSGDGDYAESDVVPISADAPPAGKQFDQWTGDVAAVADVNAPSTTVTMPAANVTVTAVYQSITPLGNDAPQQWSAVPKDFSFSVLSGRWAAVGINPLNVNKDIKASPNSDFSLPYRDSTCSGNIHDFVVVNGNKTGSCAYYARVHKGTPSNYWIEAENNPPTLTVGTRLYHQGMTSDQVFDLYQVRLIAGHHYRIRVDLVTGSTSDVSLYVFAASRSTGRRGAAPYNKPDCDGYADRNRTGRSEYLNFTPKTTGIAGILVSNIKDGGSCRYSIKVERVY